MDKNVEIGSYPSTRVVSDPIEPKNNADPISNSSITKGIYSELIKNCKLNIFSSSDPKEYKLYPGDKYRLTNTSSTSAVTSALD